MDRQLLTPLPGHNVYPQIEILMPNTLFTFIPESCSGSSGNTVRHHPGIAFILPRIPHFRKKKGNLTNAHWSDSLERRST